MLIDIIPHVFPRKHIDVPKCQNHTSQTAREQIWPNPGQHEQLVLFELCRYKPSDAEGIYRNWRMQIDQKLAAQAVASGSGQGGAGEGGTV